MGKLPFVHIRVTRDVLLLNGAGHIVRRALRPDKVSSNNSYTTLQGGSIRSAPVKTDLFMNSLILYRACRSSEEELMGGGKLMRGYKGGGDRSVSWPW